MSEIPKSSTVRKDQSLAVRVVDLTFHPIITVQEAMESFVFPDKIDGIEH